MKKLFPLTASILVLFFYAARAQDELKDFEAKEAKKDTRVFRLTAFNGGTEQVTVIPDYKQHVLLITCLTDRIAISDFWGVPPEMTMLNKNFLQIQYVLRGGSGVGLGNTLILCLSKDKLVEAMHVLRYLNGEDGHEQDDYHVKFTLSGHNQQNYKLTALVHDDVYSKPEPENNYVYNNRTLLNFDSTLQVFYSVKGMLYNYKLIKKNKKPVFHKWGKVYPEIILGTNVYYFIDNRWYTPHDINALNEVY